MGRRYVALPFCEMHSTLFLTYHCHFSSLNITFRPSFSLRSHQIFHLTRKSEMPPAISNLTWHLVPSPCKWMAMLQQFATLWEISLVRYVVKKRQETYNWDQLMSTHFWKLLSKNIFTFTYICTTVLNVKRWKIFISREISREKTNLLHHPLIGVHRHQ